MRIAIIGPGLMPIPPLGWGAVEILIWNHKIYLEKLGHTVDVFNTTNLQEIADKINTTEYDFIHLQYDAYAAFFKEHLKKPFCITSHYGWLPLASKWEDSYRQMFNDSLNIPGTIVLSEVIKNIYLQAGYKGFIRILRNGVETDKFNFKPEGNGKAVCVGNIQPRKKQALLTQLLGGLVNIDFVGPNFKGGKDVDKRTVELMPNAKVDFASMDYEPNFKENETCKYIGAWSKDEVYKNLTDYNCLVLASESEADPLVVKEAFAAGLSVVVSEESSANLTDEPFINVLKNEDFLDGNLSEIINLSIKNNDKQRKEIRQYALDKFDYSVIIKEYVKIMEEFKKAS